MYIYILRSESQAQFRTVGADTRLGRIIVSKNNKATMILYSKTSRRQQPMEFLKSCRSRTADSQKKRAHVRYE